MRQTCPTHIIEAANPMYSEAGTIVYLGGDEIYSRSVKNISIHLGSSI